MKIITAVVALCFLCSTGFATVTYDNSVTVEGFTVSTVTTGSFTITSNANRVAILALYSAVAVTSVSGSCGGTSASAISGASVTNTVEVQLWQVIAPPSGSQTCTMSWTGATAVSLGVITAYGVNQSTPTQNGGAASSGCGFATTCSLTVTSTSGNLTSTVGGNTNASNTQTTNQTRKTTDFGSMDIGPGTGTTTHTWTDVASNWTIAGVDIVAAGGVVTPVTVSNRVKQRAR